MGLASIITDLAPLFERPTLQSTRVDEVLYGMSVQVIQESDTGWCYVRTEYNTEGYTPTACLDSNAEIATAWRKYKKSTVLASYIDIQEQPLPSAPRLISVPRGGIIVPLAPPDTTGWQKVGLTDGTVGFTFANYLADVITDWKDLEEENMRWNIVETALSYNGTAWRTGGRSPLGIDSIGLAAMAYLMNGVSILREPFIKPGFAVHSIELKNINEGDLIYFRDSIGIFMGDDRFVHATTYTGSEGVIVSSLNPKEADYRGDLAQHIVAVGSLY